LDLFAHQDATGNDPGLPLGGRFMFFRWGHEMNGTWYPWSPEYRLSESGPWLTNDDPTTTSQDHTFDGPRMYKESYRRIWDIFARNFRGTDVDNGEEIVWVFSPNHYSVGRFASPTVNDKDSPLDKCHVPSHWNYWDNYYPSSTLDEYVDWIGVDGYNEDVTFKKGKTFAEVFTCTYASYASRSSKPFMIAETGSVLNSTLKSEAPFTRSQYLSGARDKIKTDWGRIKAFVYFNHLPKYYTPQSEIPQALRPMGLDCYFYRRGAGC
ncbi:MAG: hypothetical protein M3245_05750, partial [Actinomycetota bacterium]|nr:hypothetical protein [Actinomycetota bacterium]